MTNINKLNTLIAEVFADFVTSEKLGELWTNNTEVQKQLKSIMNTKADLVKRKDPNAPKRGKSAYLFFCTDHRDEVKKKLGAESKATDVTKELGVQWNKLKSSTKSADKKSLTKYEQMASDDKVRYQTEKENYVPPEDYENVKGRRRGKKADEPKRAKSAYLFFCTQNRDAVKTSNPEFKATEITAELGKMWNELKADETRASEIEGYNKMASYDKVRYQNEKNVKTQPVEVKEEIIEEVDEKPAPKKTAPKKVATKKVKMGKKNDLITPTKTGYQIFSDAKKDEFKEQFPKAKASEITKKIALAWKELTKEEQEGWSNAEIPVPSK